MRNLAEKPLVFYVYVWKFVCGSAGGLSPQRALQNLESDLFKDKAVQLFKCLVRGKWNRYWSKCLCSGQNVCSVSSHLSYLLLRCYPEEVIITEKQLCASKSFFAWNFYASVRLHTVCLMYKINWCINQIMSSM